MSVRMLISLAKYEIALFKAVPSYMRVCEGLCGIAVQKEGEPGDQATYIE